VKALLRPEALARLSAPEHRFCPTSECPVVYFGQDEVFDRRELAVPVFQKEPRGARTVCYCFAISEKDIRRELLETGHSSASERITALVKADRCACELKNPQGSCCLGNVAETTKELERAREEQEVSHHAYGGQPREGSRRSQERIVSVGPNVVRPSARASRPLRCAAALRVSSASMIDPRRVQAPGAPNPSRGGLELLKHPLGGVRHERARVLGRLAQRSQRR